VPDSAIISLPSPEATRQFGRQMAELLFPNSVIALVGNLGAGKTFLVRAIAEGLGLPAGALVTSPTFVLVQEYAGRLPIYHFDVYRLKSASEFFDLGANEYFEAGGVCLVEWADRVERQLPRDHLRLTLHVTGEQSRRVEMEGYGPGHEALVRAIAGSD
jgi:tRNA threonylcarbamoyladenosine biosynthesis protein TsaE